MLSIGYIRVGTRAIGVEALKQGYADGYGQLAVAVSPRLDICFGSKPASFTRRCSADGQYLLRKSKNKKQKQKGQTRGLTMEAKTKGSDHGVCG